MVFSMKKRMSLVSLILCMCLFSVVITPKTAVNAAETANTAYTLHQVGSQLYNENGVAVRLLGVNVPHLAWTEAGPALTEVEKMVDLAIGDWQSNVVRLAVKPHYWNNGVYKLQNGKLVLGSNGQPQLVCSAEDYRKLVDRMVEKVAAAGKYLLLDNHSFYLPGEDSVKFWENAAVRYKNHPNVIFGLFNEPAKCSWDQWKNGGRIVYNGQNDWGQAEEIDITSKGLQHLLNTVRATGAKNLVTVSGLEWGYDLTYVTTDYKLTDGEDTNGLMYETHIYPERDSDYESCVGVAASQYPVLVGECGPMFGNQYYTNLKDEQAQVYMENLCNFMDRYELHLTAWSLGSAPNLLGSGTNPTNYGKMIKEYIISNQEQKSVTLYENYDYQGNALSLNPGLYTIDQINAAGFNYNNLASLKSKSNAFQYAFVFFENADGSGNYYTLINGIKNFHKINLGFTPKALVVQRYIASNVLENNTSITVSNADSANLENLIDGTTAKWESTREGYQTLIFKLKKPCMLTEIALYHAAQAGEMEVNNTLSYALSVSDNGTIYTRIADVKNNNMSITNHRFDPIVVSHIKVVIKEGSFLDATRACLSEVRAYGLEYSGEIAKLPSRIIAEANGNDSTPSLPEPEPDVPDSNEAPVDSEPVVPVESIDSSEPSSDIESVSSEMSISSEISSDTPVHSGMSTLAVVGIVVGSVLGVVLIVAIVIVSVTVSRKKKKTENER